MKKTFFFGSVVALAASLMTGCGGNFAHTLTPNPLNPNLDVAGQVYGGRQAIVQARIYLFAASTNGYGSSSTPPISLLQPASNTTLDTTNGYYYATTGDGGAFNLTGDYTCLQGQNVWLYSIGGQPTTGVTNPIAGLMATIGTCPSTGSFAGQYQYLYVNEVSTIATAYALAGFASDATHISSPPDQQSIVGITNAFSDANQLYDLNGGGIETGARAATPEGSGTVPQTLLNSLANTLAACIDSTGVSSTACKSLFKYAPGTTVETASAAIYIAQHPGSNTNNLLKIGTSNYPWSPSLAKNPDSLNVSIVYTGFSSPNSVAIDDSGDVWVDDFGNAEYKELSPWGVVLAGGTSYPALQSGPRSTVTDQAGNTWVNNFNAGTITETIGDSTPVD